MLRLGLGLALVGALAACGSDSNDNDIGRATVNGSVMGDSIDTGAIAWHATLTGTSTSVIVIHEAGVACNPDINSGNDLAITFNCALESGSYSVATDGDGTCPDQIAALLEESGADLAFGTGGSISLSEGESLTGSFDIDFGEESLSGSFNLRNCGEISLPE